MFPFIIFSDSNMEDEYNYMHADLDSPAMPKWDEKTIQEAGDLIGYPLDSTKIRSQFHNSFSTCELNIL